MEETGPAPSAGAEPTAAAETPTPSAGAAEPTQDQMLDRMFSDEGGGDEVGDVGATSPDPGLTTEPEPVEAAPEEEKPPATEPTETPEKSPEAVEEPISERPEPPYLKSALQALQGHPKLARAVRDAHYKLSQYEDLFDNPAEATKIREAFPTWADVEETRQSVAEYQQLTSAFNEDPGGFTVALAQSDPQRLASWLVVLPEALATVPGQEEGSRDTRFYRLAAHAFVSKFFENARRVVGDDPTKLEALEIVEGIAKVKGGEPQRRSEEDPVYRENVQLRKRELERVRGEVTTFRDGAVKEYEGQLKTRIEKYLAAPWMAGAYTAGAREQIAKEIQETVTAKMKGFLGDSLSQKVLAGARDEAHRGELVKGLMDRAGSQLRIVGREILSRWRKDILGANAKDRDKRREIASRKDVGSGTGAGGARELTPPRKKLTPEDYQKFSDVDMLEGKHLQR